MLARLADIKGATWGLLAVVWVGMILALVGVAFRADGNSATRDARQQVEIEDLAARVHLLETRPAAP